MSENDPAEELTRLEAQIAATELERAAVDARLRSLRDRRAVLLAPYGVGDRLKRIYSNLPDDRSGPEYIVGRVYAGAGAPHGWTLEVYLNGEVGGHWQGDFPFRKVGEATDEQMETVRRAIEERMVRLAARAVSEGGARVHATTAT